MNTSFSFKVKQYKLLIGLTIDEQESMSLEPCDQMMADSLHIDENQEFSSTKPLKVLYAKASKCEPSSCCKDNNVRSNFKV